MNVIVFDAKPYDQQFFERANQAFGYTITYAKYRLSPENAITAQGHDVACAFVNDDLGEGTIKQLIKAGVKLVAMRCAGYNNVHLAACLGSLHVVRVPAYSPHAVAEHAVALMLSLNRKTHRAYYRTRDSNFAINGLLGFDMVGKTAGVIGTGLIGRLVAEILRGFKMDVVAYDPYPNTDWAATSGVSYVPLDELYRRANIVTLHCPLTAENHHLINQAAIASMRDDVMLINTGRGGLIDSRALVNALKHGEIGAAGLDVYEEEDQYFFEDFSNEVLTDDTLARLLSFPNVLVTSHQGFFTEEALTSIAETTLGNIRDFAAGKPLTNEICYQCSEGGCPRETTGRCF
jgi:D-lactate dehydrogenase